MAFEIFVHPAAAPALWRALLDAGKPFGLVPVGMAARDGLRVEAGLPLYGHELAGPLDLNPADAGFDPYVKLYKPFFVGKAAYLAHEMQRQSRLMRFRFDEERARVPRLGDVIVSREGRVVGAVTSGSVDSEGWLTGLGYVELPFIKRGSRLGIFQVDRGSWSSKPLESLKAGDRLQLHDDITVIRRFLNKKE
jgi:glycine hydroxymethyltransferase